MIRQSKQKMNFFSFKFVHNLFITELKAFKKNSNNILKRDVRVTERLYNVNSNNIDMINCLIDKSYII